MKKKTNKDSQTDKESKVAATLKFFSWREIRHPRFFENIFVTYFVFSVPKPIRARKFNARKFKNFEKNDLKEFWETKNEIFWFWNEIILKREPEKRRFQPFFSQLLDLMEENCLKIFIQENFTNLIFFIFRKKSFLEPILLQNNYF